MNQRLVNIFAVSGVVVGLILLILFVVLPLGRGFNNLRIKVSKNNEKLSELAERETRLQKFLRDKDEVAALASRAAAYLPDSPETGKYIRELEGMGAQSKTGVSSISFQPERKEKGSDLSTVSVSIVSDGDFTSVLSFLSGLETNIRFSSFENVQLSGLARGAVTLRLEGVIFVKPMKDFAADLSSLAIDPKVKTKLSDLNQYATPFDSGALQAPGRPNPFLEF
jgi:Tfp pilus assembly protein PilO